MQRCSKMSVKYLDSDLAVYSRLILNTAVTDWIRYSSLTDYGIYILEQRARQKLTT